jgi:hypothetical protein
MTPTSWLDQVGIASLQAPSHYQPTELVALLLPIPILWLFVGREYGCPSAEHMALHSPRMRLLIGIAHGSLLG